MYADKWGEEIQVSIAYQFELASCCMNEEQVSEHNYYMHN